MSSARKHQEIIALLYISCAVFLILLSALNIQKLSSIPVVLGASIVVNEDKILQDKIYWEELVSKNPTYYDGWAELYRINLTLGLHDEAQKAYSIAKRIDFNR
jgi:hypothetical protein